MSIVHLSSIVTDALFRDDQLAAFRSFIKNPAPIVAYRIGCAMMMVNQDLGLGCIYYANALRIFMTAKMTSSEDLLRVAYEKQHNRSAEHFRRLGHNALDCNLNEIFVLDK